MALDHFHSHLADPTLHIGTDSLLASVARFLLLMGCFVALPAEQIAAQVGGRSEIFVGSELETYLRALQIDGRVGLYP